MKLSLVLLLIGMLQVSASVHSQGSKLKLKERNITLAELFWKIQSKTDFVFAFSNEDVEMFSNINVDAEGEIEEVLNELLADKELTFELKNGVYVIQRKAPALKSVMLVDQQEEKEITVRGSVLDEKGEAIPGVTVYIKGTSVGTITMVDGSYNITVPKSADVLVFSFIGFEPQEVKLAGQTSLNIVLKTEATDLDEVVVTGYGIKKKGTYTGSVEVVDAKKIEQVPVASFDQILQGNAPGVLSVGSSGAPGAPATVRIRGLSSLSSGNSPLYIMDGIPITAGQFSALNQNDIENMSILKDATATSLYGSRASNGVIVITTKRGKDSERAMIQYRGQYGSNQIANDNFDMMSSAQKIQYEEELGLQDYTDKEKFDRLKVNTNWLDVVLRDAVTQSHELSARGGNERSKFYVSGGYYSEEGIQYRSDFERYTFRLNLDNKLSDKVNLGVNFTLGYETFNHTVSSGTNVYNPIFSARLLNPYLRAYNVDGSFNQEGLPWANPIEQLMLNDDSNDRFKIVGGLFLDVDLAENLKFKTNWGVDFSDGTADGFLSPESEWGAAYNGEVSRSMSRNFRLTPTNTLNYKLNLNDVHDFNFLIGQEAIVNNSQSFSVSAYNVPSEKLSVLSVASEAGSWGGGYSDYTVASFFANTAYNYKYKYLVDVSIRRDGSSRFGKNNRWGTFWSFGLGWNMQEESFIKGIDWIDQLKIRASIGETGNYNIGNYTHQGLYSYGSYLNNGAAVFSQYANDDLTWEKVLKANVAFEMSFFRKYRLKADFYRETTSDMLFFIPYSLTSGVGGRMENAGSLSNSGVEVEVDATLLSTQDFRFNVNANMAYNVSNIIELYGDTDKIDQGNTIIKEGERRGTYYMTEWAGVDASTGKGLWYTADGEVSNMYSDSYRVVQEGKSYLPPLQGGFTGTLSYRNLQLSAFFTWMADKWLINNTRYFIESQGMFAAYNQTAEMLNYWQEPGDVAVNPHPKYQDNQFDTRLLEDASFLRLKNLTLAYSFNSKLLKRTKVFRNARIYAQGQNLLTWTGYSGIDPEYYGVAEVNMYPHARKIMFGIDLGF
ncbi:TonB-dependent receptor [Carboxylicivirga sp. M1479]|uniref:SusC/RagA family TonB-linked outer membrane protein n=1 Tax=Carboxylicivirga sp. M1479 TaxID=2594476 RepID=UPI00163DD5E0|nr:TonB-dependent receptor [Carboxylicivirga sp. M1479]